MPTKTLPIDAFNPATYNPREDLQPGDPRYERIKRSLTRFGMVGSLVGNERTGNLVGGHQRRKILIAEGVKECEFFVVNIDETEEKALNLVLNSPDFEGGWVKDKVDEMLGAIESVAPDMYDEMELHLLARLEVDTEDDDTAVADDVVKGEPVGPAAMELLPYEHYDYILVMARDSRDYIALLDHFGIKKARVPDFVGSKKIGIGRVVDAAKYLGRMRTMLAETSGTPAERIKAILNTVPPDDKAKVLQQVTTV